MKRAKFSVFRCKIEEIIPVADLSLEEIRRLESIGFQKYLDPDSIDRPKEGLRRIPIPYGPEELELPQVCYSLEINGGVCGQSGMGLTEIRCKSGIKLVSMIWGTNSHIDIVPPKSLITEGAVPKMVLNEATAKMFDGLVLEKIEFTDQKNIVFHFSDGAQLIDYSARSFSGISSVWTIAEDSSCIYDAI